MNQKRQSRIVQLALESLNVYGHELNRTFTTIDTYNGTPTEIELGTRIVKIPTDDEIQTIMGKRKRNQQGNWRTKQILEIGLQHLETFQNDLREDDQEITNEEIEECIENLDTIIQKYPNIPTPSQAWNVYSPHEEDGEMTLIDTVFYDASCDSNWVKDGLINHDGYHPNTQVCRA